MTDEAGTRAIPMPTPHFPQRLGQGPWSDDLVSASLCALILWFAWVVQVEPRPEGVAAPPFFPVGICLVLVLFFALGALVIGDLIFAGFFAGVLSLLIVPDKLPEVLTFFLWCPSSFSVYSMPAVLNAGAIRFSLRLSTCWPPGQAFERLVLSFA